MRAAQLFRIASLGLFLGGVSLAGCGDDAKSTTDGGPDATVSTGDGSTSTDTGTTSDGGASSDVATTTDVAASGDGSADVAASGDGSAGDTAAAGDGSATD